MSPHLPRKKYLGQFDGHLLLRLRISQLPTLKSFFYLSQFFRFSILKITSILEYSLQLASTDISCINIGNHGDFLMICMLREIISNRHLRTSYFPIYEYIRSKKKNETYFKKHVGSNVSTTFKIYTVNSILNKNEEKY